MSDLSKPSFTIRISENEDGTLEVWSKGMPDTRSFGGQLMEHVPRTHLLGLHGLGAILKAGEFQGWLKPENAEPAQPDTRGE